MEVKLSKIEEMVKICQKQARSAWNKGVLLYCFEFVQNLKKWGVEEVGVDGLEKKILNGASDWDDYSRSGNTLISNWRIAFRLCTPSELKKTKNGSLKPNEYEEWLETQARALKQAYQKIEVITRLLSLE